MASQLRSSTRLSLRPRRCYDYVKKMKSAAEFTLADVTKTLHKHRHDLSEKHTVTVCRNARLREFTINPLITLRSFKSEMDACLEYGNPDAHFVEGVKQYFALNNPEKGLEHLEISAKNNHELGNYLYAILLLITGDHERGMEYMDLHKWRKNKLAVNNCWKKLKRSLRDVPILKRKYYGTNMLLIMPPRKCIIQDLNKSCNRCFYYKQMEKFLSLIISP